MNEGKTNQVEWAAANEANLIAFLVKHPEDTKDFVEFEASRTMADIIRKPKQKKSSMKT